MSLRSNWDEIMEALGSVLDAPEPVVEEPAVPEGEVVQTTEAVEAEVPEVVAEAAAELSPDAGAEVVAGNPAISESPRQRKAREKAEKKAAATG